MKQFTLDHSLQCAQLDLSELTHGKTRDHLHQNLRQLSPGEHCHQVRHRQHQVLETAGLDWQQLLLAGEHQLHQAQQHLPQHGLEWFRSLASIEVTDKLGNMVRNQKLKFVKFGENIIEENLTKFVKTLLLKFL